MVRTALFQGVNTGSIPVGTTMYKKKKIAKKKHAKKAGKSVGLRNR